MQEGNRIIRRASLPQDAEGIMAVYSAAKAIMVSSGNANQWKEGYPSLDIVQSDIEKNGAYVIEERLRVGETSAKRLSTNGAQERSGMRLACQRII